jgi:hypothetical protein
MKMIATTAAASSVNASSSMAASSTSATSIISGSSAVIKRKVKQTVTKQQQDGKQLSSSTGAGAGGGGGADDSKQLDIEGALSASPPFGITINDLHYTPSRALSIELNAERRIRAEACHFISILGQKCEITQLAIATASVYFHVFYTRVGIPPVLNPSATLLVNSSTVNMNMNMNTATPLVTFDMYELGATCLFLAGKAEERRIRVDKVIEAYYAIKPQFIPDRDAYGRIIRKVAPSGDSPEFERSRQKIYSIEELLLDVIQFEFDVKHPYTYLITFIKDKIYGKEYADACKYIQLAITCLVSSPLVLCDLSCDMSVR